MGGKNSKSTPNGGSSPRSKSATRSHPLHKHLLTLQDEFEKPNVRLESLLFVHSYVERNSAAIQENPSSPGAPNSPEASENPFAALGSLKEQHQVWTSVVQLLQVCTDEESKIQIVQTLLLVVAVQREHHSNVFQHSTTFSTFQSLVVPLIKIVQNIVVQLGKQLEGENNNKGKLLILLLRLVVELIQYSNYNSTPTADMFEDLNKLIASHHQVAVRFQAALCITQLAALLSHDGLERIGLLCTPHHLVTIHSLLQQSLHMSSGSSASMEEMPDDWDITLMKRVACDMLQLYTVCGRTDSAKPSTNRNMTLLAHENTLILLERCVPQMRGKPDMNTLIVGERLASALAAILWEGIEGNMITKIPDALVLTIIGIMNRVLRRRLRLLRNPAQKKMLLMQLELIERIEHQCSKMLRCLSKINQGLKEANHGVINTLVNLLATTHPVRSDIVHKMRIHAVTCLGIIVQHRPEEANIDVVLHPQFPSLLSQLRDLSDPQFVGRGLWVLFHLVPHSSNTNDMFNPALSASVAAISQLMENVITNDLHSNDVIQIMQKCVALLEVMLPSGTQTDMTTMCDAVTGLLTDTLPLEPVEQYIMKYMGPQSPSLQCYQRVVKILESYVQQKRGSSDSPARGNLPGDDVKSSPVQRSPLMNIQPMSSPHLNEQYLQYTFNEDSLFSRHPVMQPVTLDYSDLSPKSEMAMSPSRSSFLYSSYIQSNVHVESPTVHDHSPKLSATLSSPSLNILKKVVPLYSRGPLSPCALELADIPDTPSLFSSASSRSVSMCSEASQLSSNTPDTSSPNNDQAKSGKLVALVNDANADVRNRLITTQPRDCTIASSRSDVSDTCDTFCSSLGTNDPPLASEAINLGFDESQWR